MSTDNNTSKQNDRELLELAAKAAGYKVVGYVDEFGDYEWGGDEWGLELEDGYWIWNPLKNDADALRLVVKLGLSVDVMLREGERSRTISANNDVTICGSVLHDGDPYGATRRAIVCAAALIAMRGGEK